VRNAFVPFFAISKFEGPYDGINPSVGVNVREAGTQKGMPPPKLMDSIVPIFSKRFKDFSVAEGPMEVQVSSHPAGYLRMNFTDEAKGSPGQVTYEAWVVVRGNLMFTISAITREDEANGTRQEVKEIIDTIKIE
jgi:hypothetical protein